MGALTISTLALPTCGRHLPPQPDRVREPLWLVVAPPATIRSAASSRLRTTRCPFWAAGSDAWVRPDVTSTGVAPAASAASTSVGGSPTTYDSDRWNIGSAAT